MRSLAYCAKINLIIKVFSVKFDFGSSLNKSIAELRDLHQCIIKMGGIDDDELLTV
jgi:hypothetical protein